jgi:hypothetical protein
MPYEYHANVRRMNVCETLNEKDDLRSPYPFASNRADLHAQRKYDGTGLGEAAGRMVCARGYGVFQQSVGECIVRCWKARKDVQQCFKTVRKWEECY